MTEKEVHAGQSNIRPGLVIAAPVLGRVELMPAARNGVIGMACNSTGGSASRGRAATSRGINFSLASKSIQRRRWQ